MKSIQTAPSVGYTFTVRFRYGAMSRSHQSLLLVHKGFKRDTIR